MKKEKKELIKWGYSIISPYIFPYIIFMFVSMLIKYIETLEPIYTGKIIDSLTLYDRFLFIKQLLFMFFLLFLI